MHSIFATQFRRSKKRTQKKNSPPCCNMQPQTSSSGRPASLRPVASLQKRRLDVHRLWTSLKNRHDHAIGPMRVQNASGPEEWNLPFAILLLFVLSI